MANYTLTAASVLASATAQKKLAVAGATITAGQAIYLDASDSNKAKLADANVSAAVAALAGIALNGASAGQPISYVEADDDFTHGLTTVAAGDIIILSATAGAFCPAADLASASYPVVAMVATSATKARLRITVGLAVKP